MYIERAVRGELIFPDVIEKLRFRDQTVRVFDEITKERKLHAGEFLRLATDSYGLILLIHGKLAVSKDIRLRLFFHGTETAEHDLDLGKKDAEGIRLFDIVVATDI